MIIHKKIYIYWENMLKTENETNIYSLSLQAAAAIIQV